MHTHFWAREVVERIHSADWMSVLRAIAAAEAEQLEVLEKRLIEEQLLL